MQPRKRRRQKLQALCAVSVDDKFDITYEDKWAHMSVKDDRGAVSSSYRANSVAALEALRTAATDAGTTGTGHDQEAQVFNGSYVSGTGGLEDDDEDSPCPRSAHL